MKIKDIHAIQILSSRGYPTIRTKVILDDDSFGIADVPSGASKGKNEALELIDKDENVYRGLSVYKAINNINKVICKSLKGMDISTSLVADLKLNSLDSTEQKSKLGANAILSTSIAIAKALAKSNKMELFQSLDEIKNIYSLPVPMLNIINGGMHASNNIDIQEFMILPVGADSFSDAIRMASEIYMSLKGKLSSKNLLGGVGDEGGFAPNLGSDEEALDLIMDSIKDAGYIPGKDVLISLDVAASSWKVENEDLYVFPKSKKQFTTDELIRFYEQLIYKYPIFSIEDGLDETDYSGWIKFNQLLKDKLVLIGDDLYVTNYNLLKRGIDENWSNGILIKPNQIGTVTETITTINLAKENNFIYIVSHRSGDTSDSFISDLAVAKNALLIKAGAPCRSERVEKYNRLLEIEDMYETEYNGKKISKIFSSFSSYRF